MPDDCIFCKIVKHEQEASIVYEDDKVIAILDIAPISKGHTLVLPKEHHGTFLDLPDDLARDVNQVTKKLTSAIKKATGADGVNVTTNIHPAAGQTVPHAHFHIIPRYHGDGFERWPQGKYEEGEMEEYSEKIKSAFHHAE